jgi:hypothetical protein
LADYKFSVKSLLALAKVDAIILFKSNEAKSHSSSQTSPATVRISKDSDDMIVDLTTDYGIANFKRIMDLLILPIVQNLKTAEFGRQLHTKSVRNAFGQFTTQIVSTFSMTSLTSDTNIERFQKFLTDFNELDLRAETKVENVVNKQIFYQDLFYLYNLILNNETYGDNRLSPIFQDYLKSKTSLGYKYLTHYSKIDLRQHSPFDLDNPLLSDEQKMEYQYTLNNMILFSAFHQGGELLVKPTANDYAEAFMLKNSDFPINTMMQLSKTESAQRYAEFVELRAILSSSNLFIYYKCS